MAIETDPITGMPKKPKPKRIGLLMSARKTPTDSLYMQDQSQGLLSPSGGGYDYNALRNQYIQQYMQQYMQAMQARKSQIEDAQDQKAKTFLAKKALNKGVDYASSPNIENQASYNTPTATENYIDTGSMYGGQTAANTPTDSEAYIDAGKMGEGGKSSNSDSGSYLGAATGALSGYAQGTASEHTNPDYTSGKDDYGKYDTLGTGGGIKGKDGKVYYDKRGQIGHTIGGGFLGYWGGSPLVSSVARWSDPYLEDMTRSVINLGDRLGGVTGAVMLDPIGAIASGKYSTNEIGKAGLLAPLGPLNILNSGDSGTKEKAKQVLDPGNVISDIFGW